MAPNFDLSRFSSTLLFYLNGTEVILTNPDPGTTLLQYVRSIGLTGSKLGCAEGGCGACTVLVSSFNKATKKIRHSNVNGCLTPLCSVDGKHVITIEGLGTYKDPHPVQQRIALCFGSQCGFCTPGIAMSLYALLRNNPTPSEQEVEESFDGNLCRCTGYRPILDAAKSFSKSSDSCCGGANGAKGGCCKDQKFRRNGSTVPQESSVRFPSVHFKTYDPTQELIFPPRLMKKTAEPLYFQGRKTCWFRPTTLAEVLLIKASFPEAKFVGGNTEVGIETKFKQQQYSPLVYLHDVQELQRIKITTESMTIGANVTIANFQKALEEAVETVGQQHQTPVLRAFLDNIKYFAGQQIRNVSSVAGNVTTASPISDLNPVFIASNSTFSILSSAQLAESTVRVVPATEFFLGYRKTALNPSTDLLTEIHIPFTRPGEYIRSFKQAKRKDDDISIVTAAIRVQFVPGSSTVEEIVFGYGGMAAFTCQAQRTSAFLKGKTWGDKDILDKALALLDVDLPMQISTPGGMPEYRRTLAKSLFVRFWWDVIEQENLSIQHDHGDIRMLTKEIHRNVSFAWQSDKGTVQNSDTEVVSKSLAAVSAMKQVTGEAKYTDDMPRLHNELYAALVLSTHAHAKVLGVDPSAALAYPGVRGFFDHRCIPGSNTWGTIVEDELIFVKDMVNCVGQNIGLIVADTQAIAQEAARLVKINYIDLPVIITIDEAIAADSYICEPKSIVNGDVDAAFATCAKIFEGEMRIGGQEHFYLETQAVIANYKGEDEIEIYASTQGLNEAQLAVCKVLNLSANKVTCKVKRLGGGFGGKESRTVPLICALSVASFHTKRPIRCMLDRNEDMATSGHRNPYMGRWKAGLDENDKFVALDVQLYLNAGWSADLSAAVMERSLTQIDGVYRFPNLRVVGHCCRTNLPSNTAFRGFGSPQANLITECFMVEIAEQINMPVDKFRELNFSKEGDLTHYNQELVDYHLPKGYMQLKTRANYDAHRTAVTEFNKLSRWRKRGLSLIPIKYGIGISVLHLNQAGALIHIYHDGSVLLSHGGIEMGQGLHTKMIQVCAEGLKIPVETIHTVDNSTDRVANTSSTAASISSDLNGMAVKDACDQLNERLEPYRTKGLSWIETIHQAYFDRVNLSANGFYKAPDIGYDWESNTGQLFCYFTLGVAMSEVEVDLLTGAHTILRSDICMDVGRSINPGIDIGQIEGAFMQGVGLTTTEEPLWSPDGRMFTQGPGAYKIPSFRCIPQEFNISFFEDVTHDSIKTIYKSKGIGEPPLFLGSSVYFAIRDALRYARQENGHPGTFTLLSPATAERIRMAVGDPIAESSKLLAKEGERLWALPSF